MIRPMEEEDSSMPMETSIKEIGKMIGLMGGGFTFTKTDQVIQDSGSKMFSMDMGSKSGMTGLRMKGKKLP